MIAYQISVFAENKPGRLAKVTAILAKEKINIRAISISTSDEFGVINLLVDNPKEGQKALAKEGLTASLKQVVAILIEDRPGGLDKLVQLLARENVNVENAYGFVLESWKRAVFVIEVDQIQRTQEILKEAGFETLNAEELSAVEPFHYMKY
jgi:hypothetical protein